MTKNPEFSLERLAEGMDIPDEVLSLITGPRLLPGEVEDDYYEYLMQAVYDVDPTNLLEWLAVLELTELLWESHRYRRLKDALTKLSYAEGIEVALRSTISEECDRSPAQVRRQAEREAFDWRDQPDRRGHIEERLQKRGYDSDVLSALAVIQGAVSLSNVDKELATARKRRSRIFRDIQIRRQSADRTRKDQ